MNTLFPLATETELAQGDNTCIICREEMTVESGAKKLPCNHIFHPNCLRSWFQRQQTCPTCRNGVLGFQRRPNIIPGAAAPQAQPAPAAAAGNILPGFNNFNANILFGGNAPNRPMMAFGPVHHMAANQPQGQGAIPPMQQAQPQVFHPNFVNPFNPMFGMHPPMMAPPPFPPSVQPAPPQPMPNGQQQPTTTPPTQAQSQAPTASSQQAGTSASATHHQPSFYTPGMFPSFHSPFPFPQPPTFAGLSDAEIAEMEGRERANIEARINVLRNISVLLDSAVLQLQQYMTIAPQIHVFTESGSSGLGTADAGIQSTSQRPSRESAPTANGPPEESKPSTSKPSEPEDTSDELRRRRLAKFESGQSTTATMEDNTGRDN